MILFELFLTFLKIGAFTFGGGYAMIPLIQEEVLGHGWLSMEEIVDFIAVSESTPGPIAINMATYVGTEVAGLLGAAIATFSVVLPSFIVIILIAKLFSKFSSNKYVDAAMSGVRPVVVGLIATSVFSVGKAVFFPDGVAASAMFTPEFFFSLVMAAAGFLMLKKKVNPILVIVVCAAAGIAFGYAIKLL